VVLDVIVTDGHQGSLSSMGVATNNIHIIRDPSAVTSSGNEAVSIEGNVASLRIGETDDSESLVANPQASSLEMALQPPPTSFTTYFQPRAGNGMAQQDPLQELRLQMDGLLGRLQQAEQKTEQIQQQMEEVLGRTQQTDHQVQEVLGKIQESDQKMQEALGTIREADRQQEEVLGTTQQTDLQAQSIQRLQQQLGEALEKIQQMDQQTKHSQEQYEQLLQQRRQETLQAFHYLALVQYRVQAILTESSKNLPVPRLFIVLPEPTAVVDGQKGLHLQVRLHFLCECDAHKVNNNINGKGLYEVHLTNHPGYELVNQDEFIDKYGSYLLTMMYMVKYGAKARGLVVLPLLGLQSATEDDENQEHLHFIRKNIRSLVDDVITYLESVINATNRRTIIPIHQNLDLLALVQLESYLKGKNNERPIEDLWPITTQNGHCAWLCRYHILEYHALALQRLKKIVTGAGGGFGLGVKITSETTAKLLYDMISEICRVQNMEDWESLKNGNFEPSSLSSAAESTSNTINDLKSLSLEFSRLSMVVDGIPRGAIGDVAFEVAQLCDLTSDDLELIRLCQPVGLTILRASHETDGARLIDILQHSTKLRNLHVRCDIFSTFILINSVLSTRERALQISGQSALRTLDVMREGPVPPKSDGFCSRCHCVDTVTASFSEDSRRFETHVHMSRMWLSASFDGFIRQYGWSIKTFGAPGILTDNHAKLLDEVTQERGSIIEYLALAPCQLSGTGLNALDRVITRSQKFVSVELFLLGLDKEDQLKKALPVLGRYNNRLKSLYLRGEATGWLKRLAEAFPDKDDFPVLEGLCGRYGDPRGEGSQGLIAWLKSESQPVKLFCSTSTDRVGDKGLLHQWASSSR
jgi:hypothetical protein